MHGTYCNMKLTLRTGDTISVLLSQLLLSLLGHNHSVIVSRHLRVRELASKTMRGTRHGAVA